MLAAGGNMVAFPLYCPPGPIAILGLVNPASRMHSPSKASLQSYCVHCPAIPVHSQASEGSLTWYLQGAGTMAQLIHSLFPSLHMVGWELDPAVVQAGRDHMGLTDLEATKALVSLSHVCGCLQLVEMKTTP